MNGRDRLRTVLNPGSVAIVGASDNPGKIDGARGLVSGGVARLRVARHASTLLVVEHGDCGSVEARGLVSGGVARLRAARLRPPGHEARCSSGVDADRTFE